MWSDLKERFRFGLTLFLFFSSTRRCTHCWPKEISGRRQGSNAQDYRRNSGFTKGDMCSSQQRFHKSSTILQKRLVHRSKPCEC